MRKMNAFIKKAFEWGDRIPTGVLLENRSVPTFSQRLALRTESYGEVPPARRSIADAEGRSLADLSSFLAEMTVGQA